MTRVLVTGCSSGFGRATVQELVARGHEVVATARRPEAIADLDVASCLRLDVDDDASVRAAIAAAGDVEAVVNNAGLGVLGPVERLPFGECRRLFETNFFGAVRIIQAVLPAMRARGSGTIVNVSSVAGRVGPPFEGFYAATKFALEGMSEALYFEVGHFGIRVRIVEPGIVSTGFQGRVLRYGMDEPPYDRLARQWEEARARLVGSDEVPSPEAVAGVIVDSIESPDARLRWPVGADAELVLGARSSMDDTEFESAMRAVLDVDW